MLSGKLHGAAHSAELSPFEENIQNVVLSPPVQVLEPGEPGVRRAIYDEDAVRTSTANNESSPPKRRPNDPPTCTAAPTFEDTTHPTTPPDHRTANRLLDGRHQQADEVARNAASTTSEHRSTGRQTDEQPQTACEPLPIEVAKHGSQVMN